MAMLCSGSFAADFTFQPPDCGGDLGGVRPVKVLWQPVAEGGEVQELTSERPGQFLAEVAHRSDVMVVLHFPGTDGADAAAKLFNHVMQSAGLPEGEEEPLGGGITAELPDGFVPGFYRDGDGALVAGTDNHGQVRALDILLTPAPPAYRAKLLALIRPR